jgi:hypothetical protein
MLVRDLRQPCGGGVRVRCFRKQRRQVASVDPRGMLRGCSSPLGLVTHTPPSLRSSSVVV